MSQSLTVECEFHVTPKSHGPVSRGKSLAARPALPTARVPRVSRLMALAIHFDGLLRDGKAKDYAEIARLGYVTRARVTQIMNLLMLAPDIQEEILFLSTFERGHEPFTLRQLQPIAVTTIWAKQRDLWKQLCRA